MTTTFTRLTDFDLAPFRPYYAATPRADEPVSTRPGEQTFWTAEGARATGAVTLDWKVEPGGWTLVLMNA